MRVKKTTSKDRGETLEPLGVLTLPVTTDRYIDASGKLIEGKSAMWLRFPMFEATAPDGTRFDVCNSGGTIIVGVYREGFESQYVAFSLVPAIEQIDKLTESCAIPNPKAGDGLNDAAGAGER